MLTTYELRDRRRALDQALQEADLDGRKRASLEERLGAVIAEQQERARSPWSGA
ncbi:MAG: hypothetical protein ACLP3Q_08525 [Streptosporangiaceae bacterium]